MPPPCLMIKQIFAAWSLGRAPAQPPSLHRNEISTKLLLCYDLSGMSEIITLEKFLWGVVVFLKTALVVLLLYRKNNRIYPYFFAYALVTLSHDPFLLVCYQIWGFSSQTAVTLAWSTQGLVIASRVLAVVEICRHVLGIYRGIWVMVWRSFLAVAGSVLLFSWVISRHQWQVSIINADRGIEFALAVVLVVFVLFARYYEIGMGPTDRSLAIGFVLFSCFSVLNNTLLERWLWDYATLWNLLGTLAFIATLLIWIWAFRKAQTKTAPVLVMLPSGVYGMHVPQINLRLKLLNRQLESFWHVKPENE